MSESQDNSQSNSVARAASKSTKKEEKKKDRIKTLDQFTSELDLLMETHIKHKQKSLECKQLGSELKILRDRILPFMLDNLKQHRANCTKHKMYITSTITNRARKIHLQDIYEIIEKELGPENKKLIFEKALELRKQKVAMRQTKIAPISTKRSDEKKRRLDEIKNAALSGLPVPKKAKTSRPKKTTETSIES